MSMLISDESHKALMIAKRMGTLDIELWQHQPFMNLQEKIRTLAQSHAVDTGYRLKRMTFAQMAGINGEFPCTTAVGIVMVRFE